MEPEHSRTHDLGTYAGEVFFRAIVIDSGDPSPADILEYPLTDRSRCSICVDETLPVLAEWDLGGLVRRCRETIERVIEINTNSQCSPLCCNFTL